MCYLVLSCVTREISLYIFFFHQTIWFNLMRHNKHLMQNYIVTLKSKCQKEYKIQRNLLLFVVAAILFENLSKTEENRISTLTLQHLPQIFHCFLDHDTRIATLSPHENLDASIPGASHVPGYLRLVFFQSFVRCGLHNRQGDRLLRHGHASATIWTAVTFYL